MFGLRIIENDKKTKIERNISGGPEVRIILFKEKIGDFFFQAEDGIRDAQESRGLGDVYKRQNNKCNEKHSFLFVKTHALRHLHQRLISNRSQYILTCE